MSGKVLKKRSKENESFERQAICRQQIAYEQGIHPIDLYAPRSRYHR